MLGQISGMKIIVSKFAYKTKTVVRGIADSRRPNRVKPLYRRVTIHIPLMYKVGNDIVCAPEWEARIRQAFQQSRALDVCPSCAGKGIKQIGVYAETCPACHGAGTRQ